MIKNVQCNLVNSITPTNIVKKINNVSFKGANDIFESVPETIFGEFTKDEVQGIISTIANGRSNDSGCTSSIFKFKDKIIKVPFANTSNSEHTLLKKGQTLKEYFALNKIKEIDPDIATNPQGIIKNEGRYYLVEELINGKHPKGNHLSQNHIKDLLSKFFKLDTNGIANCDLHSGNIFLLDENKTKLIDFGSFHCVMNNGSIFNSEYCPIDYFKPGGQFISDSAKDNKTRILNSFLNNSFEDFKSQADNPYLKIPSNATNFEFRTICSHLKDGSEEKPLEFFKEYLKSKSKNYHEHLKEFLESLNFANADTTNYKPEQINSAKSSLKNAINYEKLAQKVLSSPTDDTVKVELAKMQVRRFLQYNEPDKPKKLQAAYNQLISTLEEGIKNSNGEQKEYYTETMKFFKDKFQNFQFVEGQTAIPENEDLIKTLFENTKQELKNTAIKSSDKKGVLLAAAGIITAASITGAIIVKKAKAKKETLAEKNKQQEKETPQIKEQEQKETTNPIVKNQQTTTPSNNIFMQKTPDVFAQFKL